jgi:hypothetical protein
MAIFSIGLPVLWRFGAKHQEEERALAIDPNMAVARAQMGVTQMVVSRAEETEAYVLEAIRLRMTR